MVYSYDLTHAEPILRDIRVYNASAAMYIGQPVCSGPVATAENTGCGIAVTANVLSNIIGVLNEDMATTDLSVVATGVDKYAKVIINPLAVYKAEYSMLAADDNAITTADSTGKTTTVTDTHLDDAERCWVYITNVGSSTDGYGNLFQVGAASTTVLTAATSYDDNLSANAVGDTFIIIHAGNGQSAVVGGDVDLATDTRNISGHDGTASAGAAQVIENFIGSAYRPIEPLRCATHSGYNYKDEVPKFYADLIFTEHVYLAGAVVNDRVIT